MPQTANSRPSPPTPTNAGTSYGTSATRTGRSSQSANAIHQVPGGRAAIAPASASMLGNSATRVRYRAMERLWAPWRLQYVKSAATAANDECVFCAKLGADDREALVLHRGTRCFAMLNLYPYTN